MEFYSLFKDFGPSVAYLIITLMILRQLWKQYKKCKKEHKNEKKAMQENFEVALKRILDEKAELTKENKELHEQKYDIAIKSHEVLSQVIPYLKGRGEVQ